MRLILPIIILFLSSCYVSEELPPDQSIWEYDLPSSQGLVQNELLLIDERIKRGEFQEMEGLVIIRNGKLVFENYYSERASRAFITNVGSAGLCITLAALGIAADQRILSLSDPIVDYLPEYEEIFADTPDKANITIEHLLIHQSGLSWNESITSILDPRNNLIQMKNASDWIAYVLNRPLEASPGLRFSFNTASGILLAKIIENASGSSFDTFLQENLFSPLSVAEIQIEQDPTGNFNGGDGYSLNLLDLTQIGYLYLQDGIWEGRRILDPNFVQESITEQVQVSSFQSLGYMWSLFGDGFENQLGIDHREVYYLRGALGQSLFVIPSEEMVVSIFADNFFGFNNLSLNLFAEITFLIQ